MFRTAVAAGHLREDGRINNLTAGARSAERSVNWWHVGDPFFFFFYALRIKTESLSDVNKTMESINVLFNEICTVGQS